MLNDKRNVLLAQAKEDISLALRPDISLVVQQSRKLDFILSRGERRKTGFFRNKPKAGHFGAVPSDCR
jgi:hypothetical protein